MQRRKALIQMGAGTAGLLLAPGLMQALSQRDGIVHLADLIRSTPRDEVLEAVAGAVHAGADYRTLLGAAFLAGIQDVEPRHVGGKLHCVMMVESAFQMADTLPAKEALLLALWNIDDFKRSQVRDRRGGDWVMPPRPEASMPDETTARGELVAAMEAWDVQRADRAVVALLGHADINSTFEVLWPYCGRSFVDIGHKIIYGAQLQRVLHRIGPRYGEPTLRSLTFGLLHTDNSGNRHTTVYDRSLGLTSSLPGGWLKGKEAPERSVDILQALRTADSEQAQKIIIDAFKSGLGPRTVWDGLRLSASEIFLRRPAAPPERSQSLLPVHAVTEVNAFGHVFRAAGNEETKRLMILQAAGWLPDMREALVVRNAHLKDGPALETLGDSVEKTPRLDAAFEQRSPGLVCATLSRNPGEATTYRGRMRRFLASKGVEHHQHKYAAVFLEESMTVEKRWAPFILAPSIDYLPTAAVSDTDVARRSVRALEKAGVLT